jgi:hypothetical protein
VTVRRYTDREIADAWTQYRMAIKGSSVPDTLDFVDAANYDALVAELAQARSDRQREHDLRVQLVGTVESQAARIAELEAALRPAASCQHDLQLPECTIKVTDHGTRATCSECREVWTSNI